MLVSLSVIVWSRGHKKNKRVVRQRQNSIMRYVSFCILLFASVHFCSFSTVIRCICRRLVTLSQYSRVTAKLHSEWNGFYSCEIAQVFLGCATEKQETSLVRIQLGQHKSLHVFIMMMYPILLDSVINIQLSMNSLSGLCIFHIVGARFR